jgi:hypothetical protein
MENDLKLLDEYPMIVQPSLAAALGLSEAIVLQQIHYWLVTLRRSNSKNHYRDGRWWVYNSIRQWQCDNFIWWNPKTVERILKALEDKGLIETDNFNGASYDRTKWYTINYDRLRELVAEGGAAAPFAQSGEMDSHNLSEGGLRQNVVMVPTKCLNLYHRLPETIKTHHTPGCDNGRADFLVDENTEFILVNAQAETRVDAGEPPVEDSPSPADADEGEDADSVEDTGEDTHHQEMPNAAPSKSKLPYIPTNIGGKRASDDNEELEDIDEYGNPIKNPKPAKQTKAELMMIDFYVKLDEGIRGKKVQTVPFRRELKNLLKKDQRIEVDGKTKTYPSIVHMVSTNPAYRDWLTRFLKRQLDFQLKKGRDITRETLIEKVQNGLSSFLAEEKQRQEAEQRKNQGSIDTPTWKWTLRNVVDGKGMAYAGAEDVREMTVEEFLAKHPDGEVIE